MSKIVCDICGTTYSDTEDQCPICGCAKDVSVTDLTEELLEQEVSVAAPAVTFAAKGKKAVVKEEIFDDDDDDDDDYDDDYDDDDDDEDDYDDDDDDEYDEEEH